MAAIGAIIDDKYEILKLVGKGGMSKVYLAMDKRLNKQWAVKEIEKNARDKNNKVVVQSAIAEANLIKRLDHKTLPRIVDILDNGNVIYIIMDYIEGESLNKVLDREGAQSQEQVIEWAKDLCEVLDYLHTREPAIIYRDMKPANIMLKPDGTLKLIDFGIAREYKEYNLEDTKNLGTEGYAAPEQFGGQGQTDARTDIYCLGVTLYHLVTGQNPCEPPYELYPIRHWNPSLSAGLEAIIQKCTQRNPIDRYQSCAELMYALEHYEEADEAYVNQQKGKLKKFIYSASATLACVLIGCLFLLLNANDNNSNYKTYIQTAKNNSIFYEAVEADDSASNESANAKINQYLAAIDIKPKNLDNYKDEQNPYFAIIDACEMRVINDYDNAATPEEQNMIKDELDDVMNQLITKLNLSYEENDRSELYSELSYKIAEYYLYFGPNQDATKIERATPWIAKAQQTENKYAKSATLMNTVLEFNDTVKLYSKTRGNDDNVALSQLANVKKAIDSLVNEDNGTKYNVYRLALLVLGQKSVIEYMEASLDYTQNDIDSLIGVVVRDFLDTQSDSNAESLRNAYNVFEEHLKQYGGDQ